MYSLSFYSEVYTDIKTAYDWYELQRVGLGEDFLLSLEETFAKITKDPKHYQVVYRGIRRKLIRRFPYGVYYLLREDTLVVMAVMHTRRSTKSWKERIEE